MARKRTKRTAGPKPTPRGSAATRGAAPAARDRERTPRRADGAPAAGAAAAPPEAAATAELRPSVVEAGLPVVGIGASAGGLEALEVFLKNVPDRSGVAWVIVQHLDPADKGTMVSLLQRSTRMKVVQVADRQEVEANHVYVIPPARDMSILHGILHVMPHTAPRGLNLPVDFFFRALAADRQERAVSVVLSGMGSDGTLGIRAIKEKGARHSSSPSTRPSSTACRAAPSTPASWT